MLHTNSDHGAAAMVVQRQLRCVNTPINLQRRVFSIVILQHSKVMILFLPSHDIDRENPNHRIV
jgi:hypothetical protein